MLLVAGCSTASGAASDTADGSGGEIQANNWVLRSYDVGGSLTIVPDDLYADADFRAQRVNGFAGCNTYDAVYWASGRQLLVSMAATTLMACEDPAASFETAYRPEQPPARIVDRRLLCVRAGHDQGPARGNGADGRLPAEDGERVVRLQYLRRPLYDEWHGRRDRPAGHHPDGLRR